MEKSPAGEGFTVKAALGDVPPYAAVMLTAVVVVTALVVTLKLALVAPARTVTLAGTCATDVLLLESETTVSAGAAALKVTVPVEMLFPMTLLGLRLTDEIDTAPEQAGKRNEAIRVLHALPLTGWYSVVNQKVQSSTGSTVMLL